VDRHRWGRVVAALVGVALVAGCGTTGEPGKQAEAVKLSRAQLESAVLDAETVADFEFSPMSRKEIRGWRDRFEARPTACLPLADVRSMRMRPEPDAVAATTGVAPETVGGANPVVTVVLGTYGAGDAEAAFKRLRAAVRVCGDGFSATVDTSPVPQRYAAVVERDAPKGGGAAISYELSSSLWGIPRTQTVTVIRSGSTLVYFGTIPEAEGSARGIPDAVVTAQLAKLTKVRQRAAD